MKIVFTAQSKQQFYCRDAVCIYTFNQGAIPLNPFRLFDYYLGERVDRKVIRFANDQLIAQSDELWVFGQTIANGVAREIEHAINRDKYVRFFTISPYVEDIRALTTYEVEHLEPETEDVNLIELDAQLSNYWANQYNS